MILIGYVLSKLFTVKDTFTQMFKIWCRLLNILLNLCSLYQILNFLEKKMTLLAYVFSKLLTVKNIVTQRFK